MPVQRFIFWLASVLIAVVLLIVFAVVYVALSERDSAAGMVVLMAICVDLTSLPLLVWNPSWAARTGGVLTLVLAFSLQAVALFGT
jgi:hypothetical protein